MYKIHTYGPNNSFYFGVRQDPFQSYQFLTRNEELDKTLLSITMDLSL
jgi:hypothetical protein